MTSKLKSAIPLIDAETVKVNVAVLVCPGFNVAPARFQLKVMNCVQFEGFQLEAGTDIDKVRTWSPSFLM